MSERDGWQANTIDEVLERLDEILGWAAAEKSRFGYFAALYKGVTLNVLDGIENGSFEDAARMERFDAIFASRYLEAVHTYRAGGQPTRSWTFAFDSAGGARPVILQHLLLGINAHINLDLGVAAAEVAKGGELGALKGDFQAINSILAARVSVVQDQIGRVSPLIFLLGRIDPSAGRAVINFNIERARDQAWTIAELLACLDPGAWPERIDVLDRSTTSLARLIRDPPGWVLKNGLGIIRLGERRDVPDVMQVLQELAAP